jgi:hypothetical protein
MTGQPMPGNDTDAAQHAAAARVRDERSGWVVIWVARKSQFQARPDFPAPADTVVTGSTPEELTAGIDRFKVKSRPAAGQRS